MIPESVKVGYYDYRIEWVDVDLVENCEVCDGVIDSNEQVIKLCSKRGEQLHELTWWHEVFHAIIHARNLKFSNTDDTEKAVEELSRGIYELMKDNHYLFPGQFGNSEGKEIDK